MKIFYLLLDYLYGANYQVWKTFGSKRTGYVIGERMTSFWFGILTVFPLSLIAARFFKLSFIVSAVLLILLTCIILIQWNRRYKYVEDDNMDERCIKFMKLPFWAKLPFYAIAVIMPLIVLIIIYGLITGKLN